MSDWHLYLVRTGDGSLYAGISTDVERRFVEHCGDTTRGSRYLRGRGPLELVYSQRIGEQGLALRAENRVKRLSKDRKEEIVRSNPGEQEILELLHLEDGMILHIAERTEWQAARDQGFYEGPTLASEGFVHASRRAQVIEVANRFFRGRDDLVLLVIDEERLGAEVRPENLEGGTVLYPHIYGSIECEAVSSVLPFPPEPDGRFILPAVLGGSD